MSTPSFRCFTEKRRGRKPSGPVRDGRHPVIGCGCLSSALCMDKYRAHQVAAACGIPVPKAILFSAMPQSADLQKVGEELGYPSLCKTAARRFFFWNYQSNRFRSAAAGRRRSVRLRSGDPARRKYRRFRSGLRNTGKGSATLRPGGRNSAFLRFL